MSLHITIYRELYSTYVKTEAEVSLHVRNMLAPLRDYGDLDLGIIRPNPSFQAHWVCLYKGPCPLQAHWVCLYRIKQLDDMLRFCLQQVEEKWKKEINKSISSLVTHLYTSV